MVILLITAPLQTQDSQFFWRDTNTEPLSTLLKLCSHFCAQFYEVWLKIGRHRVGCLSLHTTHQKVTRGVFPEKLKELSLGLVVSAGGVRFKASLGTVLGKQLFREVACTNNIILGNHALLAAGEWRETERDDALTRHLPTCLDIHSTFKYLAFSGAYEYKKIYCITVGFRYLTCSWYFYSVRNIKLTLCFLCDDYLQMSERRPLFVGHQDPRIVSI